MAKALEVVAHLLLLGGQLVVVVEVLPAASPAGAEVGALRVGAFGRVLLDGYGAAFGIVLLFLYYFNVGHIAWHNKGDEDHHAVHAGNGFPFGSDVGDEDVFENGLFFLSFHKMGSVSTSRARVSDTLRFA